MIRCRYLPAWIRNGGPGFRRSWLIIAATITLVLIAVVVYGFSFFRLRHSLRVTGPDFVARHCYLFSEDPARNRKLVTFYRPMITFTGGVVEVEYNLLSRETQQSSDPALYLTEFEEGAWGGGLLSE